MTGRPRIMVVDDELGPRESLRMILQDNYEVVTAANSEIALNHLTKTEFDMAILDIRMPDINGIELLSQVKAKAPLTEVVMITAYASVDTATKALRYGALDYLIKPFDLKAVQEVVKNGVNRYQENMATRNQISDLQIANESLEKEVENSYRNIQDHYEETVKSLVAAVDAKDSYTKGHQERVAGQVLEIGQRLKMNKNDLGILQHAAKLHDIGKIGIAESILMKKGLFTDEEYSIIKKHSLIGARILSPVKFMKEVIPLVLHHHEHYDGSGYPDGLQGTAIPIGARIIAIADAIDAMLSERPYASAKTVAEVKDELHRNSGTQFDPELVNLVLKDGFFVI